MKSSREVTEAVLRRRDRYETHKAEQTKKYKKIAGGVLSVFLIAVLGAGVFNMKNNPEPPVHGSGGGEASEVANGAKEPTEKKHDFAYFLDGTRPDSSTVKVISGFDTPEEGSYAVPKNGDIGKTIAVMEALDHYAKEDVAFLFAIDLFRDENEITGAEKAKESERLSKLGYQMTLSTFTNEEGEEFSETVIMLTAKELKEFKNSENYGYFFSFPTSVGTEDNGGEIVHYDAHAE